jgi:hypothetical protein
MKRSLRWMATMVAIGLAALAGYVVHRPAPTRAARPAADPGAATEIDELRSKIGQLEQAMTYGSARLASLESAAGPGGRSAGMGAAREGGADVQRRGAPPSQEEVAERQARVTARFDAALKDEPRDRSWAPGFESTIQDSVKATVGTGHGPTVETVSCRTSVCRLELAYGTKDSQRQFLQAFPAHRPPMTAARWTNNPSSDGTGKLTIDFVREGYPVPGTEKSTD